MKVPYTAACSTLSSTQPSYLSHTSQYISAACSTQLPSLHLTNLPIPLSYHQVRLRRSHSAEIETSKQVRDPRKGKGEQRRGRGETDANKQRMNSASTGEAVAQRKKL